MTPNELVLTPLSATALFVVAVLAGYRYRKAWKTAAPGWRKWAFGLTAAICLLILALTPLTPSGGF